MALRNKHLFHAYRSIDWLTKLCFRLKIRFKTMCFSFYPPNIQGKCFSFQIEKSLRTVSKVFNDSP